MAADNDSQSTPNNNLPRNLDQILDQVRTIQNEVNLQKRTKEALDNAAQETYDFNKDFKHDNDKSLMERV